MSFTAPFALRRTPAAARAATCLKALPHFATTPVFVLRTMATHADLLNVAAEIKIDHDNVRDLFQRFKSTSSKEDKGVLANTLIREMAIHSDAEEVTVYNHYNKHGLGDTVEHNKEEHAEVKKLVYDADSASIDDPNYDQIMSTAVSNFLNHAEDEENNQLPELVGKLTPEENDLIAKEFIKARVMVPSRPHPAAPQTGGIAQKAAGLQGKLHDKIIETLGNRKFTDVKYAHPQI